MSTAQQTAVVELAAAEGRALEGGLASPALVLAVKVCFPMLLAVSMLSCGMFLERLVCLPGAGCRST